MGINKSPGATGRPFVLRSVGKSRPYGGREMCVDVQSKRTAVLWPKWQRVFGAVQRFIHVASALRENLKVAKALVVPGPRDVDAHATDRPRAADGRLGIGATVMNAGPVAAPCPRGGDNEIWSTWLGARSSYEYGSDGPPRTQSQTEEARMSQEHGKWPVTQPVVSIIVPVYDVEAYLNHCASIRF